MAWVAAGAETDGAADAAEAPDRQAAPEVQQVEQREGGPDPRAAAQGQAGA